LKLKSDWIIAEAEELETEIGDPDLLLKSPMIVKDQELVRYIPDRTGSRVKSSVSYIS
jgi:hypothetical protein